MDIEALVITSNNSPMQKYMWAELESDSSYIVFDMDSALSGLGAKFYKTLTDPFLNYCFDLPGKVHWYRDALRSIPEDLNPQIILVNEWVQALYYQSFVTYLRQRFPHSAICFKSENPIVQASGFESKRFVARYKKIIKTVSRFYDYGCAFTAEDAKELDWLYPGDVFSYIQLPSGKALPESDLLFVGKNKGRLNRILQVYEEARKQGLKCDFHITGVLESQMRYQEDIIYNVPMSYEEYRARMHSTLCIVDIVPDNCPYTTLRPLEAMIYRKKLLTNNSLIMEKEYYDGRLMKCFSTAGEIDFSFIHARDSGEYRGEVSPKKYIGCLLALIDDREKHKTR